MVLIRQSKNVYKALIVAEYVGVEIKVVDNFEFGVSNTAPEFLKMNPIGKVPVLETPDGPIFESNAIARYVAHGSFLFGSSPIEYGQIEQWIDFSAFEFDLNIRGWYIPRMGYGNYIKPVEENCIFGLKRGLDALNKYLASHTFLVGDGVTLADIVTTCNLLMAFKLLTPKSFTSEYPHVERYFWTMINQPKFSKVVGEVKQTEAVIPLSSAKKLAAKPKPEAKKEVNKEEAPKPAVQVTEEDAPKPNLIYCLQVRWFWMTGRGFTRTPRLTSVKLQSKGFGIFLIQRVTRFGFAITSTMTKTLSRL